MRQRTKWILSDLWDIAKATLTVVLILAVMFVVGFFSWTHGYREGKREGVLQCSAASNGS